MAMAMMAMAVVAMVAMVVMPVNVVVVQILKSIGAEAIIGESTNSKLCYLSRRRRWSWCPNPHRGALFPLRIRAKWVAHHCRLPFAGSPFRSRAWSARKTSNVSPDDVAAVGKGGGLSTAPSSIHNLP